MTDKHPLSVPVAAVAARPVDRARPGGAELEKSARLLQDDRAPRKSSAVELLEANEHLLLAALDAQTIAESAISNLNVVARTSQHDALTDLPNRTLMFDRLQSALSLAHRRGSCLAVLFVDLDHFKHINDDFGHTLGDEVLQAVARRLTSVVRESDTVSRYGGDEFMIVLPEISSPSDAAVIALKILSQLAKPLSLRGRTFACTASIGIATYPKNAEDAGSLIAHADAAMYRSKRRAPGGFLFYSDEMVNDRSHIPPPRYDGPSQDHKDVQALAQPEPGLPQMREVNRQLLMAALTAQTLKRTAEDAHQRQVQFLAMLAHELRNPLAPLLSSARLLRSEAVTADGVQHLGVVMERQVQYLTRLVDDLLDIARITSGKIVLRKEGVQLRSVLEDAVEIGRETIAAGGIELTVDLPPPELMIEADSTRLVQIVSNLLSNAAKFTLPEGRIRLSAGQQGQHVVISVRDTGVGIDTALLPRVFDLFVQADGHADHSPGGLGIGLAVVKAMVELHGGTVEALSAGPGSGSEFIVRLPSATVVAVPSRDEALDGGKPEQAGRVLIVDDDSDGLEVLSMMCRHWGHEVCSAPDGVAALQLLPSFEPDLVLLDIGLPGPDGYEIARRIRAGTGGQAIVLIALTGHGQADDRRRALEAGFDSHLVKPVHPVEMKEVLASMIAAGRPV